MTSATLSTSGAATKTKSSKGFLLRRDDTSILARWWWTLDKPLFVMILSLFGIGLMMLLASAPAVASRINASANALIIKQLIFVPVALVALIGMSMFCPKGIRRLGVIGMLGGFGLLLLTLLVGTEIKGATRWLSFGGFSLQVSEFVKPTLAIGCAWMLAEWRSSLGYKGCVIALILYVLSVTLLILQPDFGMVSVVSVVFWTQFFLAGLPIGFVSGVFAICGGGALAAYTFLPHVHDRVNRFLNPADNDTYQIDHAIHAFKSSGLFGVGPGEGVIKTLIPDSHADFVFAVMAEEYGVLLCLVTVALFGGILLRGSALLLKERDLFIFLATAGLLAQFTIQAFVNMASSLAIIPTKGMTLPFISYGGSSLVAIALGMGMVLGLTRKRAEG